MASVPPERVTSAAVSLFFRPAYSTSGAGIAAPVVTEMLLGRTIRLALFTVITVLSACPTVVSEE